MIALEGVTCLHGSRAAVLNLSGRFVAGSMTALVGPNGAGKTTLLRAIAGLHRDTTGQIRRGGRIALLAQTPSLERGFPLTCAEVVAMGGYAASSLFGTAASSRRIIEALAAVGLPGFGRRLVSSLSGGQFQRLLFARLMLQDAAVLLLDEPFANIDAATASDLMRMLHRWHDAGRTIVIALHDIELARRDIPATLLLARRAIAWGSSEEVLSEANLLRARDALAEPAVRDAA